jgi:radical SAM superfamily enzyme YgiQ (UPF0313 family)
MKKSIKKVLFVIPSYSDNVIDNYTNSVVLPYGVLSLVSYLEYHCPELEFRVIDFNIKSNDQNFFEILDTEMVNFKPDMVGFSIMYNACKKYIAPFAESVKKIDPEVILIAGGIMATNMPKEVFEETNLIDAICHGEGELPLRDLITSQNIYQTLKHHASFAMSVDLAEGKKPHATFIENLDEIPLLNYSYIDITKYSSRISSKDGQDKLTLPIHSTRGCPFSCIFCCSAANHGRKIRYMTSKRFLNDAKQMIEKYKITKLSIDDDQFLFNSKRTKEILTGLADLHIELEMANGLSVKFIDDEIAELLKKAGLKIAVLAIESGSQNVLSKIINKPLNIEQIAPAVNALKRHGLSVHTFFIIGFPGETEEDRELTRNLILDIGFDWNGIFIATPYKGSRLYEECIENGYLTEKNISDATIYKCEITAPGIDPFHITREAYLLNLDVNFVNNYNFKRCAYEKAASYFKGVAEKYPSHAFAHYFLAKTLEYIPESTKEIIELHYKKYKEIKDTNKEWYEYAKHFNLIEKLGE